MRGIPTDEGSQHANLPVSRRLRSPRPDGTRLFVGVEFVGCVPACRGAGAAFRGCAHFGESTRESEPHVLLPVVKAGVLAVQ